MGRRLGMAFPTASLLLLSLLAPIDAKFGLHLMNVNGLPKGVGDCYKVTNLKWNTRPSPHGRKRKQKAKADGIEFRDSASRKRNRKMNQTHVCGSVAYPTMLVFVEAEPFTFIDESGSGLVGFFPALMKSIAEAPNLDYSGACDHHSRTQLQFSVKCNQVALCQTTQAAQHLLLDPTYSKQIMFGMGPFLRNNGTQGPVAGITFSNYTLPGKWGAIFPIKPGDVLDDFLQAFWVQLQAASVALLAYVFVMTHVMYVIVNWKHIKRQMRKLVNFFTCGKCCYVRPRRWELQRCTCTTDPSNETAEIGHHPSCPATAAQKALQANNADQDGGAMRVSYFHGGLMDALWWVFAATTTIGCSDKTPKGPPARLLGMIIMLSSCVFASLYTSTLISTMDATKLANEISSEDHLMHMHTACWNGSGGCEIAESKGAVASRQTTVSGMLEAVSTEGGGEVEGAVYDYNSLLFAQRERKQNLSYSIVKLINPGQMLQYGIVGVNSRQKLLACVDDTIVTLKDQGDYQTTLRRWFPVTSSVNAVWMSSPESLYTVCAVIAGTGAFFIVLAVFLNWLNRFMRRRKEKKEMLERVQEERLIGSRPELEGHFKLSMEPVTDGCGVGSAPMERRSTVGRGASASAVGLGEGSEFQFRHLTQRVSQLQQQQQDTLDLLAKLVEQQGTARPGETEQLNRRPNIPPVRRQHVPGQVQQAPPIFPFPTSTSSSPDSDNSTSALLSSKAEQ